MSSLKSDLRFSLRSLRSAPGFTATAVLTLVLGIGATTVLFSVVYAVLLRPLPYDEPERLVHLVADEPGDARSGLPYLLFDALAGQSSTLEKVAVYYRNTGWSRVIVGGRSSPEIAQAGYSSAELFEVLGIPPLIGRTFGSAEVQRLERVAVISHSLWTRRFGQDAGVLGRSIDVDGQPFTIVGVMPREFQFPARDTQLWLPVSTNRFWGERPLGNDNRTRGFFMRWNLIARLRQGTAAIAAQAEVNSLAARIAEQDRNWNMGMGVKVLPMGIEIDERSKRSLLLLFGAATLVLLIACVNVANLLLARGVARTKEMAVRVALGASRARIVQQVLTESVVLVGFASAAALLVASWTDRVLIRWAPLDLPRLEEARVDASVLLFGLAASLITAVLFGLGPALRAAKPDPQEGLRSAGRSVSRGGSKASAILVVAEFAIAIVLVTSAGLLLRSLWLVESVDMGFAAERILTARLQYPPGFSESRRRSAWDRLQERLRSLPGVEGVGGIRSLFELGAPPTNHLREVEGDAAESGRNRALTWTTVSGDYFRAMGIPVLAGRVFSGADREGSNLVAVIDESMASRYWPGRDPIGRRFKGQDRRGENDDWITVIGVVRDARRQGIERDPTPHVYLWHRQSEMTNDWVIRCSTGPESLLRTVRQTVLDVEPGTVITSISAMQATLDGQVAARKFQTWLLTLFATVALVLAAVGIFGVVSHAVAQRTREIGLRMALGADQCSVIRMFVMRGAGLAAVGLGMGTVLTIGTTRLIAGLLFGVTPLDPAAFVSGLAVLMMVAVVAAAIPATRASGIDPLDALRRE